MLGPFTVWALGPFTALLWGHLRETLGAIYGSVPHPEPVNDPTILGPIYGFRVGPDLPITPKGREVSMAAGAGMARLGRRNKDVVL